MVDAAAPDDDGGNDDEGLPLPVLLIHVILELVLIP